MTKTPKRLIKLLQKKDRKSYIYLFDTYFVRLSNLAASFVYRSDIAQDIAHDTIIKIWENSDSISSPEALEYYLNTTVKNKSLNYLRSLNIEQKHNQWYLEHMESVQPVDCIVTSDFIAEVKNIIDGLPEKKREIFKLRYFSGLKYKDIAEELDMPINSIKSSLSRIVDFLRPEIKKIIAEKK